MENVTPYKFTSAVRYLISNLKDKPTKVTLPKVLSDNGFTKEKMINILIKRGIIKRKERITSDENNKQIYNVKYTLLDTKDLDGEIMKIYNDYFQDEKLKTKMNEAKMKMPIGKIFAIDKRPVRKPEKLEETDCAASSGPVEVPMTNQVIRRRILVSEEQFNTIKEIMCTKNAGDCLLNEMGEGDAGDFTYDVPFPSDDEVMRRGDGKGGSTSIPKKRVGEK